MQKNKSVVISAYAPAECRSTLEDLGFSVFDGAVLPSVDSAVAHHIDMQIVKCSDNSYVCAPCVYNHYLPVCSAADVILISGKKDPLGKYPGDIGYNIAVTGKYAIHNFRYTDDVFCQNSGYIPINANQGYTKCNICVVGESAVITSDSGIARSLKKFPVDVLLIRSGYIELPGYSYGFIGGCTGLIGSKLLAFAGDASLHPDYCNIKAFCKNHGVEICSLSKCNLVDVGTIMTVG